MPRVQLKLYGENESEPVDERILVNGFVLIGRGADCDWVLDDPDRRLSRHHCRISAEPPGVSVTDLSSNGVHLNGASERLERDAPQSLTDGDTLSVGSYRLVIAVGNQPADQDSAPSSVSAGPSGEAGLAAFMKGAGLDSTQLASGDAEALFKAGQLFRHFIDNLHDLLNDRLIVKAQFRAEATLVSRGAANPFKALTVEELPARLLAAENPGYMPAEEALDEAFKDLRRHQMAILSGMHIAVGKLIDRLSPEEIERLLRQRSTMSIMSAGGKKSASWDAYQDYFDQVEQEVADLESSQFMIDFRNGYEARLRELEDADA
ncbi:MAG: type VI secretion system-associated FHA domain protein TagH [Alphaproteobacteria bacterium]